MIAKNNNAVPRINWLTCGLFRAGLFVPANIREVFALMLKYLIMCRSLTYAQRSARALEHVGITAVVTKAPQEVSNAGCAYCVKVSERRLKEALSVLENAGLAPTRVFLQSGSGVKEISIQEGGI